MGTGKSPTGTRTETGTASVPVGKISPSLHGAVSPWPTLMSKLMPLRYATEGERAEKGVRGRYRRGHRHKPLPKQDDEGSGETTAAPVT